MWDMNEVADVTYVRDYVLHVVMDNGLAGNIDLSNYPSKGPIFEPLGDLEFFKKVTIEGGTLAWPNGADISPESVYVMVENANKSIEATA
jgi:hypothetical protein